MIVSPGPARLLQPVISSFEPASNPNQGDAKLYGTPQTLKGVAEANHDREQRSSVSPPGAFLQLAPTQLDALRHMPLQEWRTPRPSISTWGVTELKQAERPQGPGVLKTSIKMSDLAVGGDPQSLKTNKDIETVVRSTVYVAVNDRNHEFMGTGNDKASVTGNEGAICIEKSRMICGLSKEGSLYAADKALTVSDNGMLQMADPKTNSRPALIYKVNPAGMVETNRMAEANQVLPPEKQLDFAGAASKCRAVMPVLQAQFKKTKTQGIELG